jgi:hypothetical protein
LRIIILDACVVATIRSSGGESKSVDG